MKGEILLGLKPGERVHPQGVVGKDEEAAHHFLPLAAQQLEIADVGFPRPGLRAPVEAPALLQIGKLIRHTPQADKFFQRQGGG